MDAAKACTKCKSHKPLLDFYKSKLGKFGRSAACKACCRLLYGEAHRIRERVRRGGVPRVVRTAADKKAQRRTWDLKNKERVKGHSRAYYARNRDLVSARSLAWAKQNPAKANQRAMARYAAKRAAIPGWANQFFIEEAYELARLRTKVTGFKWQVDHIVPLRSKVICGLHVEHNLQVIPATQNHQKSNSWWPDMP